MVLAHETWFVNRIPPPDWGFAFQAATLVLLASALLIALGVRLAARFRGGLDIAWLARMAPFMPFVARIHVAVSLLSLLSLGYYLSPSQHLAKSPAGFALGALMVLTAIGFASGFHTREAAWLLLASGPIGMVIYGISPIVQRFDLAGLAVFVLLAGPGRWSADHELGRVRAPTAERLGLALLALRVGLGSALIVVAFVEKLANPALAREFLHQLPAFNLAHDLGLPLGEDSYIRIAGAIEVLFGLLVISGALPQLVVLGAGIPFNLTLFFLGSDELAGHLPIYGALLMLLVYGSDPGLRPLCSRLDLGRLLERGTGGASAAGITPRARVPSG